MEYFVGWMCLCDRARCALWMRGAALPMSVSWLAMSMKLLSV